MPPDHVVVRLLHHMGSQSRLHPAAVYRPTIQPQSLKVNTPMNDPITSDLSRFGARERAMLADLLTAWNRDGLPDDFYDDEVHPVLNMDSGYVFLTNSDYQTAMMNGDTLESFYSTPYEGHEGFWEDLVREYLNMCDEDRDYMHHIADGRELPEVAS